MAKRIKCNTLDMKRLTKIATALCLALTALCGVVGCSGPKAIPDGDLVKIFHDSFLANAYITECRITEDSLLLYEPILSRYGYTVEDMQYTVQTIASRKSSRLSDLVGEASQLLEDEYKSHSYKLRVLDTIDNIAKRKYTRVMYSDSLIRVRRLSDTTKLHISIDDIIPGEYTIEFEYLIDSTDENRNSRVEAYLKLKDGSSSMRHTFMLSRYHEAKYTRKFTADTSHTELHINMFYHPGTEEAKKPAIKIMNFKITRVIPILQAVDSLYWEQIGAQMFNLKLMTPYLYNEVKKEAIPMNIEPTEEIPQQARPAKADESRAKAKGTKPEAAKPEAAKPGAKPEVVKPEAARPQTSKPGAKPEVVKPEAARPQTPKPGAKPEGARPQNATPRIAKPEGGPQGLRVEGGTPKGAKVESGQNGERPKKFDPTKANREREQQR